MRKLLLGVFALLVLALPQLASAQNQNFSASDRYVAKFLCGFSEGEETRLGVVEGHYNTIINVQALKDRTFVAFLVTPISSNLEVELGVPSEISSRLTLDRDGAAGIVCNDIKNQADTGGQGFIEGFVTIYSSKPLVVESVLTGQGQGDVSTMQVIRVPSRGAGGSIRPPIVQ